MLMTIDTQENISPKMEYILFSPLKYFIDVIIPNKGQADVPTTSKYQKSSRNKTASTKANIPKTNGIHEQTEFSSELTDISLVFSAGAVALICWTAQPHFVHITASSISWFPHFTQYFM